uniref:Uncharacterized protein n=1 Tax=Neolamprologus brichardi TaxID=32507 RepID=A0A3Q4HHQ0_NEOBR
MKSKKILVSTIFVAAHQSEKGYKIISNQFKVYHSTVRKIIHKWKTFKTVARLCRTLACCLANSGHRKISKSILVLGFAMEFVLKSAVVRSSLFTLMITRLHF